VAKIVYGVSGEGSGHSSRAREMAAHLQQQGHELWLVSYDRGYRNLQEDFRVLEVEGLCIASEDNKVSVVKTFTENLKRLPAGHRTLQELRQKLFKEFRPDCVITDFEPMTAYLAQHYDIPLITLDNQHRMRYLDYACPPGHEFESEVTKNIIRAIVPRPDVSLVTAFHTGQPRNQRTFVFPPIVRREVREQTATTGEHILVYVTSGFESLLKELRTFLRERFLVYGYDRTEHEGSLTFKPFSREGFLRDLASAKAVVATAGFTLISEALYLRKPYLALPLQGQFEQELNAFQLAELGYGKRVTDLTIEAVGDFLYRLPEYETRLANYVTSDNGEIKAKLDELLADQCRLANEFHQTRR
jgi:uncharacterized protein (TIGR00661 family)